MTAREKEQTADVRERILVAASRLFIEKGYDGASVRDIAAASDTNVAMVNYYFRSKFNLFELVFGEAFSILVEEIFAVLHSDRPFFEIIETWISTYFDVLSQYPQIPNFIFTAAHQNPEGLVQKAVKYNLTALFERVSELVGAEVAKGTIKPTPPIDLMMNIVSLCVFPFVMGPLAVEVAGRSAAEYGDVIRTHKKYVIDFVRDAIKA